MTASAPKSPTKPSTSSKLSPSSAATTSPSRRCSSAAVAIDKTGSPLPTATLDAALESDAVLMGAVGDNKFNALPPDKRPEAGLLQIRAALGGFANLRPSIAYPALSGNSPLRPEVTEGVDILFVRELLGGLYFGQPRGWDREAQRAHNTMVYTRAEVVRVARIAFELAQKRRKKVTSVDKANVLEVSQLWRATVTEVAKDYPDVTLEHQLVDSMAMHLMNIPRNFDVVLTENLFGDILSDEAASSPARSACCPRPPSAARSICTSPCTAPRPTSPARARPTRSAPSSPPPWSCATPPASSRTPPPSRAPSPRSSPTATAPPTSPAEETRSQHLVSTTEMGKLVHQALAESIDRRQSMHAV